MQIMREDDIMGKENKKADLHKQILNVICKNNDNKPLSVAEVREILQETVDFTETLQFLYDTDHISN